jgi:hypothetical protein
MPEPPRRSGNGQDPPERDKENSASTGPLDITELETVYLVPPRPLQGILAHREEHLVAHKAAVDHLREQQAALVRQVVDWQTVMLAEPTASSRRAEIKLHIESLWASWSELDRQVAAHRQAVRALRGADPPPLEDQGE